MILEKTTHPRALSNSWLVGDEPGGQAVVIDTGGPVEPLEQALRRHELTLTHVLCTHHHWDHADGNSHYREAHSVPVCGHAAEAELFPDGLDVELDDGRVLAVGSLSIRALHVPGHTVGQLAFVVGDDAVFTGDTLFRRSVGGTRGPGHATFADLRRSIMGVFMALPPDMAVHPGHVDSTTVGQEWEHNPFVRAWRGVDPVGESRCRAFGEAATLLVSARDYDGGTKCWVRFDDGRLDVVPGSRVETA